MAAAHQEAQQLPCPGDRLVEAVGQLEDRRQVGGGAGEATAVAERFEQHDGAGHGLLGPRRVVDHVERARQRGERLPEGRPVAEELTEADDLACARRSLVEAGEVVEHPDAVLHDRRPLLVGQHAGPPQDEQPALYALDLYLRGELPDALATEWRDGEPPPEVVELMHQSGLAWTALVEAAAARQLP